VDPMSLSGPWLTRTSLDGAADHPYIHEAFLSRLKSRLRARPQGRLKVAALAWYPLTHYRGTRTVACSRKRPDACRVVPERPAPKEHTSRTASLIFTRT